MKSLQEIFDEVTKHLLTQNVRATTRSGSGSCMYLTPDGRRCAVGCLIPVEHYDPLIEGVAIHRLAPSAIASDQHKERWDRLGQILSLTGVDLTDDATRHVLSELQGVHDSMDPLLWRAGLEGQARRFGLQFNPPPVLVAVQEVP